MYVAVKTPQSIYGRFTVSPKSQGTNTSNKVLGQCVQSDWDHVNFPYFCFGNHLIRNLFGNAIVPIVPVLSK